LGCIDERIILLEKDFRALESVLNGVPMHLLRIDERLEAYDKVQDAFKVAEMSPRERAILPQMIRAFIDHGEEANRVAEQATTRMRSIATYATVIQAIMAVAAVLVAYWVSRH
jgi:hypothetical protein